MTIPLSGFRVLLLAPVAFILVACGGGGGGGALAPEDGNSGWTIPVEDVVDAGPGPDGIPSIDAPQFQEAAENTDLSDNDLVTGIFHEGEYRAFPHEIMNWHEVVNDSTNINAYVLSYCPLTGSAMAWDVDDTSSNKQFGVSGLLYNSNLILYDRLTDSNWSQMLQESVKGPRVNEVASQLQVIETSWLTWKTMFPDSLVLTRDTGHARDYDRYPYSGYRSNETLLFPVTNEDNRLHPKQRVVGIRSDSGSRVYQIAGFGETTQVINDQFEDQPVVVVGNSQQFFGAIYSRRLGDGTILTFSPLDNQLPNVMQDDEGNVWNIFGAAVTGPRAGEQLGTTNSYTAMWFAWAAFFINAEIYF
jgi:hypothetical protein